MTICTVTIRSQYSTDTCIKYLINDSDKNCINCKKYIFYFNIITRVIKAELLNGDVN